MGLTELLAGLGVISIALALHPFTTYPASLILIGRRSGRKPLPAAQPRSRLRFAMCTCAYNEAGAIDGKIRNLLDVCSSHLDTEVCVYVDGATDQTSEIARAWDHSIALETSQRRLGKTHGMNLLVSRCSADIVVFSDANVLLDSQLLYRLEDHFQDEDVGCVCGNLIYTNSDSSVTASTGSAYWRLEQFIKRRESTLGSVMGADGSIFAIRRHLHTPPPDDIIDDMYVSFKILCDGYRVIQVEDVQAFEESVTKSSEEFDRKVRIACQAFNVHKLLWRQMLKSFGPLRLYLYVSHKLLRWFSIYFLSVGALFLLISALLFGVPTFVWLSLPVVASVFLINKRWPLPLVSSAIDVLSSLAGAGLGVWRSLRGERFQTWEPAASIRR